MIVVWKWFESLISHKTLRTHRALWHCVAHHDLSQHILQLVIVYSIVRLKYFKLAYNVLKDYKEYIFKS